MGDLPHLDFLTNSDSPLVRGLPSTALIWEIIVNCKKMMLAALCSAAMGMMTTTASATSLLPLTFEDMAQGAAACVVGTVSATETVMIDGSPYTRATFALESAAFGDMPSEFTVIAPGGKISRGKLSTSQITAGAPRFFSGQKLLMFLDNSANGDYQITGFNQGLFAVVNGRTILNGDASSIDDVLAAAAASRN